jgi:acetylornithine deacetylase/succinyl-diaminopimelate desuccinylase-like protein
LNRRSHESAGAQDRVERIDRQFDRRYLVEIMSRLATVPTDVPLGFNTLMDPDHPKLVHYVQNVIRPELVSLGAFDLFDAPGNNLVVRMGTGESGRVLLIQNYTPAQHHNLMPNPFSGKVGNARRYGIDEPAVFGQGVSQNKAHQAVMLAVLRLLLANNITLRGRLYWAVNNEGRSTHDCSYAILGALDEKPGFCIIQIGTDLKITLGNRGRVDVDVHVRGRATHSSTPADGLSSIEGANEVINCLKKLSWPDNHPILGGRHALVYKLQFEPIAPHTLPSDAYLTIDRRLLPGDDPDEAVREIQEIIGDLAPYALEVTRGVYMLPALVDADDPGVVALQHANRAVRGHEAETIYLQGTFDAGGLCAEGIPTIMYGADGGDWPVGEDYVSVADAEVEARVLLHHILEQLA